MQGLMVFIYKHGPTDCTAKGISSRHESVIMISDTYDVPEIFEAEEDRTMKLITRSVIGKSFPILVPLDAKENGNPYMFGGNFAYTSDSRFPHDAPIKIFDRDESKPIFSDLVMRANQF